MSFRCSAKQAHALYKHGLPLSHALAMPFKVASDALKELAALSWKATPAWCEKWGGPEVFKLRPDLAPGYEPGAAAKLKAAIDQLGARITGRAEIDLGTTPITIGLVVAHRGYEMRLTPIGDMWVADAEVETPNGDLPYTTLDATSESMTGALNILAASMDRARETGERPDVDDDGKLIEEGEGP